MHIENEDEETRFKGLAEMNPGCARTPNATQVFRLKTEG